VAVTVVVAVTVWQRKIEKGRHVMGAGLALRSSIFPAHRTLAPEEQFNREF
jgi:hypothetical protein